MSLEENPTTGYLWMMRYDLTEMNVETEYESSGYSAPGSGGSRHFTIKPHNPGSLVLEYRRPWEKDQKPIRKVTVTIE